MSGCILVVEDDEPYRYTLVRTLTHAGYEVSAFGDYRGALTELDTSRQVDLLVTDIRLPEKTPHGISLALMARTRRPRLPVVFLTAYSEYVNEIPDGLGEALIKPVEGGALLEAVERAISSRVNASGA